MNVNDRNAVRLLVRVREDFQSMRKRMDNRIGRKANGEEQDIPEREFNEADLGMFSASANAAHDQEVEIEKSLKKVLKRFPVYNEYLADVKGVGPIAAGWIIAEYDIHIATTVSKMWQFTGLNPSMVRGKKRVKVADYKPAMGAIVGNIKDGDDISEYIVVTGEMVRGDRLSAGFVAPFNKRLRTAMVGVLADGFIKAGLRWAVTDESEYLENSVYCRIKDKKHQRAVIGSPQVEMYMQCKERLLHEENLVSTADPDKAKSWSEESKGHRDRAAKRYMIKMFLKDLYVAWRTLEGLPVRKPYHEEYLGHKHSA